MDTFGEDWGEQFESFQNFGNIDYTPGNYNNDPFDEQCEDQQAHYSNPVFTASNEKENPFDTHESFFSGQQFKNNENQNQNQYQTTIKIDDEKKEREVNDIGVQLQQKQKSCKLEKFGDQTYYPGDTKNIPKNFGGHLKTFIQNILTDNDRQCKSKEWVDFCNIKNQKISKANLGRFLQTDFGKKFGTPFFGSCQWAKLFLAENKSDIEQYFKFNQYRKRVKLY